MKAIVSVICAALLIAVVTAVGVLAVTAVVVFGLYWLGRRVLRQHRARAAIAAHDRAELLARAELQHRWYQAGDPRGIYGRYTPVA